MEKYIDKTYTVEEDSIIISLYDSRDSYICKNFLGDIGSIHISLSGVFMCPTLYDGIELENVKEKKLISAFKEIFGTEEYNPLSPKYYQTIRTLIENGTLKALGYELITYSDDNTISNKKKRH